MTKIFYVRHAQPNYNNHNDVLRELTPKGMQDRLLVTKFLEGRKIDAVLSSPYKRAIETIKDFADRYGFAIELAEDFRERKVDSGWIDDFTAFSKRQWSDFTYKLPGGENLHDVQVRNIRALQYVLKKYPGKNVVIGGHGTALSTMIHYFDSSFGYEEFEKIKERMPWIVEFDFDVNQNCVGIRDHCIIQECD